jgi:hypothetical protein
VRKGIYTVTLDQLTTLMPMDENACRVAKLSTRLFVGYYNGELICAMGLIPPTLLSDNAYLWLVTTPAIDKCRLVFGLNAHRFLKRILTAYPILVGHCDIKAFAWLKHLGAEIGTMQQGLFPFRITR